jgi:hypothetical protein
MVGFNEAQVEEGRKEGRKEGREKVYHERSKTMAAETLGWSWMCSACRRLMMMIGEADVDV